MASDAVSIGFLIGEAERQKAVLRLEYEEKVRGVDATIAFLSKYSEGQKDVAGAVIAKPDQDSVGGSYSKSTRLNRETSNTKDLVLAYINAREGEFSTAEIIDYFEKNHPSHQRGTILAVLSRQSDVTVERVRNGLYKALPKRESDIIRQLQEYDVSEVPEFEETNAN